MAVFFEMTPNEAILLLRFEGKISRKEILATAECASDYIRFTRRHFAIIDASLQTITADDHDTAVYWYGGLSQLPAGCRIAYVPPIASAPSRAKLISRAAADNGHRLLVYECINEATEWIRFEYDRAETIAAE
ncbi:MULTISPECIES: hypothetical protein [Alphaproteobacteria]|uniref:hypothetical protein n=1 Tax=Alphaproteobacteria TaxID=28211 RepID=UPI001AFE5297|nr:MULTISPECIES: hypothetical protein [Alphaproteobacteria]MBO6716309.1 hypothetical protein [Parvibaculum sp.]MBO6848144.1 hypothetical protein [Maricaulis sp.]MBO6878930.1 hypothetical protein [Maricaulis sp.]